MLDAEERKEYERLSKGKGKESKTKKPRKPFKEMTSFEYEEYMRESQM